MKVGDLVVFRCPAIFMKEKYKTRGVGIVIDDRIRDYYFDSSTVIAFEVQWVSGEVSWEHKTYLELL